MRHSGRSITVHASEGAEKALNVNSDGFRILTLGLRFDVNPGCINHTWGNSVRGDGGV